MISKNRDQGPAFLLDPEDILGSENFLISERVLGLAKYVSDPLSQRTSAHCTWFVHYLFHQHLFVHPFNVTSV